MQIVAGGNFDQLLAIHLHNLCQNFTEFSIHNAQLCATQPSFLVGTYINKGVSTVAILIFALTFVYKIDQLDVILVSCGQTTIFSTGHLLLAA